MSSDLCPQCFSVLKVVGEDYEDGDDADNWTDHQVNSNVYNDAITHPDKDESKKKKKPMTMTPTCVRSSPATIPLMNWCFWASDATQATSSGQLQFCFLKTLNKDKEERQR